VSGLRVLRVYHAAGEAAHRARDRALQAEGVDVTLVLPRHWPAAATIDDVPHRLLDARRVGDVNRHTYLGELSQVLCDLRPELLDVHEEPVSLAARQWLGAAGGLPAVMYSAQNIDKRWPPPFAHYERSALRRVRGLYPCSAQAASVLRGKGFAGHLEVLPLGLDPAVHRAGDQELPADEVVLGLVGRLVPEKGVQDAVRVLAAVRRRRPARLLVVGDGPERTPARDLAARLGVADSCSWSSWTDDRSLAVLYRRMHVVLVPSTATSRWVEQFGRVITEGRAAGAVPAGYASGSIPEVVGEVGLLVAEGDVEALSRAVSELLDRPATWRAMRDSGLDLAGANAWADIAARQVRFYEQALRVAPRPLRHPSGATRRAAAQEFGPSSGTPAGLRPFALPVLRKPGSGQHLLGQLVDIVTHQR